MGVNNNHRQSVVPSQYLYRVYRACLNMGARQPILLSASELSESEMRHPESRFHAEMIATLCRAGLADLGSGFALSKIADAMVPKCFSDPGYCGMFENTFGEAMEAILLAQDIGECGKDLRWQHEDGHTRLIWDQRGSYSSCFIQIYFLAISACAGTIANNQFKTVKAAYFSYPEPNDFAQFHRSTCKSDFVPCHFDQPETYLEFHPNIWDIPNPSLNIHVVNAAKHQAKQFHKTSKIPLTELTYNYLTNLLNKPGFSLDAAAKTVDIADRTLRRRLVAEGSSFRQIMEHVRRDACQLYFLEGTRSLSEISAKLGYSELSAFTRAYTAWYGHPPSHGFSMNQMAIAA